MSNLKNIAKQAFDLLLDIKELDEKLKKIENTKEILKEIDRQIDKKNL